MRLPLPRFFRRDDPVDPNVADMHVSSEWLQSLQEEDRFLVSFPRSGNRWVRTILRDVIMLSNPESSVAPNLKSVLPDIHTAKASTQSRPEPGFPARIIKSHNFRALMGRRMGYLFRQAPDALVSYYHFHVKHQTSRGNVPRISIDEFCLTMLPGWCEHIRLALEQMRKLPDKTHLISYESIQSSPHATLAGLVRFYDLPSGRDVLGQAIENNTFERSKSQAKSSQQSQGPILRQGQVGGAKAELGAEAFAQIESESAPLYREITEAARRQGGQAPP